MNKGIFDVPKVFCNGVLLLGLWTSSKSSSTNVHLCLSPSPDVVTGTLRETRNSSRCLIGRRSVARQQTK